MALLGGKTVNQILAAHRKTVNELNARSSEMEKEDTKLRKQALEIEKKRKVADLERRRARS